MTHPGVTLLLCEAGMFLVEGELFTSVHGAEASLRGGGSSRPPRAFRKPGDDVCAATRATDAMSPGRRQLSRASGPEGGEADIKVFVANLVYARIVVGRYVDALEVEKEELCEHRGRYFPRRKLCGVLYFMLQKRQYVHRRKFGVA